MRILLYGNCQSLSIGKMIHHPDIRINYIACHSTELSKKEFDREINLADIVITQPIRDNYRDREYLSTSYVINNISQSTDIILFPSIMAGNIYYFDAFKFQCLSQTTCTTKYTHKNLVDYYMQGGSNVDEFKLDFIANKNLLTAQQLEKNARNIIGELKQKESLAVKQYNVPFIPMSRFIEENWKDNLLFYMPNHCTSYLYRYLTQKICKQIGVDLSSVNLKKDPQRQGSRMILYSCLENIVKFDINKYPPPRLIFNNGKRNTIFNTTNDYIENIWKIAR